jgi:hypothetical protein
MIRTDTCSRMTGFPNPSASIKAMREQPGQGGARTQVRADSYMAARRQRGPVRIGNSQDLSFVRCIKRGEPEVR